jgi:hypothetical protein
MGLLDQLGYESASQAYRQGLLNTKDEWQPDNKRAGGHALEPPLLSPDDLIGTGIPAKLAMLIKASAVAAAPAATMGLLSTAAQQKGVTTAASRLAQVLDGQAGMIKTPVGRIPESSADTRMLADMLQRAGEKSGYVVQRSDSAISPSRYVSFTKAGDDIGETTRQVRISNHIDKYPELANGVRTSVDPATEVSFEQAVNWLGREGFPTHLSARYKDVPTWEKYYANASAARETEQAKLDGLLSAWRNLPKATRGASPTLDDVRAGITAIDLMRRAY